jgi:hypothetical protein
MFCPKCATENISGARFCRSCGIDVSLIPQALAGTLPQAAPVAEDDDDDSYRSRRRHRRDKHPSIEGGLRNIFVGVGFLMVAIALAFTPMGRMWWFWMMIPAFSMIGTGVAQYTNAKNAEKALPPHATQGDAQLPRSAFAGELPTRERSDFMAPPPTVTEGTTRHLGAEARAKVPRAEDRG